MSFNRDFDLFGIALEHHFGDDGSGVYIKRTDIPAGVFLQMHTHSFTHKSVLCSGTARVSVDGETSDVVGPAVLSITQGSKHEVVALTPCVWMCIHATDETDPDRIDHVLTGG